jgi:hypothetical protein
MRMVGWQSPYGGGSTSPLVSNNTAITKLEKALQWLLADWRAWWDALAAQTPHSTKLGKALQTLLTSCSIGGAWWDGMASIGYAKHPSYTVLDY